MKWIALTLLFVSPLSHALINYETALGYSLEGRLRAFGKDPKKSYPALALLATDPHLSIQSRWRAVVTMGRLNAKAFRAELDKALNSKEWFMRNSALIALQTDERERAVYWSTKLLTDPSLMVRTQAVRNLIGLDAREAEPILWQQLQAKHNYRGEQSLWIRAHIAEALSRFAMKGRARHFQNLLLDRDERLHKWAIIGLESVTGYKMSDRKEPVEVKRQKWLSRLGVEEV